MDEQHRRRRRPHAEQTPEMNLQSEALPPREQAQERQPAPAPKDETAAQAGQAHRRRRRADEPQEKPVGEKQENATAQNNSIFWHPEEENKQDNAAKRRRSAAKPVQAISAVDDAICRIGDACLAAIKWAGIGLLFVVGFIASGVSRLFAKAIPALRSTGKKNVHRKAVHRGKRVAPAKKAAPKEEGVTLEPTRPEDYKGMGDRRSTGNRRAGGQKKGAKRVVRAPRKKGGLLYAAAMALMICVAVVSIYEIGSILWRSISTKMLSNSLSERYSALGGDQQSEPEPEYTPESELIVYQGEETPVPFVQYVGDAAQESAQPDTQMDEQPAAQATEEPRQPDAVRATKFHQIGGDALPEMEALYKDNRDLIGWLRMEGILDLPVVYRDNEYYLTRDFYKNKSASGTLFLDENHPFKENAQNLLLHGHNMKDGTMFGRLVQYETNLQFLKNNPFIQYSTLWRKEQYVIFAVLRVSLDVRSEQFFNYFTHHTFTSDTQFENYVRALQNRSTFSIPVSVDPSDALLTLSTCLDDDRLVIVARRLREGESKSELRHLVQLADRQ